MYTSSLSPGCVYIVGAGPGDPGLLTVRGMRCLQEADVVLYDELLNHRLLDLTRDDCERIYVGKRGGRRSHSQEEINALLVEHARQESRIVRLKGGDPFVFGRGGEEAVHLFETGIPFEIVPGISAAAAVPAYAGIPLTHRGLAAAAVLVTGYEDPGKPRPTVDWQKLASLESTLVIFMGTRKLAEIAAQLLEHGRSPDTPAAVIEWGTWPSQRTAAADLAHIADEANARKIHPPALIVIGQVVQLRDQLNWFERRPLFGRRVLITRSRDQSGSLQLLLESAGAEVSLLPLLDIHPPDDPAELDGCIEKLDSFSWTIFTSPNSVDFFFTRLHELGKDTRAFGTTSVAAVGKSTAENLRDRGIHPDLIPTLQSQDGLVAAFQEIPVEGRKVLIPASAIGRTLLVEELQKRGALVSHVTAYENRPPDPAQIELPAALTEEELDLILFASPSSVENFVTLLGSARAHRILSQLHIACIGPTTTQAVTDLDLQVHVQPDESSVPALVQAICDYYSESSP